MAVGDKYYLGGQKTMSQYHTFFQIVGTTEVKTSLAFEANYVKYISNDDDTNNLMISFNDKPANTQYGLNGVIVLKPGEVLNDFNFKFTSINLKRTAGNGSVRFVVGV